MTRYLLALDQSSRVTGWSIFDLDKKEYIKSGHFEIPGDNKLEMRERLCQFTKEIDSIHSVYPFDEIVYEDIQLQRGNVKTFKTLAYFQAAIMIYCGPSDCAHPIKVTCYSPSHWRSILKDEYKIEWGRKRTEQKAAAQEFTKRQTELALTEDESDSYCIGLTYLLERDKPTSAF